MTFVDLHSIHSSLIRMIGYPSIIAVCRLISDSQWDLILICFQTLVGLIATTLVFQAIHAVTRSFYAGVFGAGCYFLSPALQYDLFVLTDSLYGHLLSILTALLVIWTCEQRPATAVRVLAAGSLLALALLIRSATMPLGLLFVAPVAVWVRRSGWKAGAIAVALFLSPLLATNSAYQGWNKLRSGEAFLAIDTLYALLQPLIAIEARGTPTFTDNATLDVTARTIFALEHGPTRAMMGPDAFTIGDHLILKDGLPAVEALRIVKARFFRVMLTHPIAFARNMAYELTTSVLFSTFDPLRVMRLLLSYRYDVDWLDARHEFLKHPVREWRIAGVTFLILETASRILGLLLLLGALVALPLHLMPAARGDRDAALLVAMVIVAAGFIGVTAMIHLEERYIIGIYPALYIAAIPTLMTRLRNFRTGLRKREPLS